MLSHERRHFLGYEIEDKRELYRAVAAFRKAQERSLSRADEDTIVRHLRDYLAPKDFVGHVISGWYIIYSGDPEDPIKEVVQRKWLFVDHKYIIDTCADKWHEEDADNYKIVITRVMPNSPYRYEKPNKNAAKFNASIKRFISNPLKAIKRKREGD